MPPDRPENGPLTAAGPPAAVAGDPSHGAGAEPSDRELLAAHVAGDPEAFGLIVARHRDRLWAVALRTLGDREDAADAVQDALISAYRAAGNFRGEAAVTTWLHRIVVNACLDRARSRKSRQTVPLPETGPNEPAEPGDPMEQRDTALAVHRALADLPDDQRAALVLVDLQGHSVADTAQILGVAEGTIKSRCARGRARLAVSLGYLRNPDASSSVQRSRRTTEEGAS
ncbi:MAG: polymerase sigma-70 factor, subfamily [Cryptosporangiaceae bacterium]|nr:polymerase sigma-70 factor, subfamily [Cryptosporangiaceae bacterium]